MTKKMHRLRWLASILLLFLPPLVLGKEIVLLLANDTEPYRQVEQGIRNSFANHKFSAEISSLTLEALQQQPNRLGSGRPLIVTVGTSATRYALKHNISDSIYASFLTASGLLKEVATDSGLPAALKGAVVLDQPAERIVQLAKIVSPQLRYLGTAMNGVGPNRLSEFNRVVGDQGLELEAAILTVDSNPIADLKRVFTKSDVFLVIPDKARFNSKIAKWVLFLSYRHRVPVIGYSQKYTDAGALISIYSTPRQVGEDTGKRLVDYLEAEAIGQAQVRLHYPRYFKLSINSKVASSLNIKIGNDAQLKEKLRQQYGVRVKDEAGLTLEIVEQ